ncbi:MAG: hypothetical protein RLZZ502_354 [Pseudomonadota bacterium]|jgi:SAM-dependent methyltransferase
MKAYLWLLAVGAGLSHAIALAQTPTQTQAQTQAQTQPSARPIEEVPFVVTPPRVVERMLQMAEVGNKDLVYDLGSGDGRIVLAAARRGAKALGVEIDPTLVQQSQANAKAERLEHLASFAVQDLFDTDFKNASVVTMYLLPEFNLKLKPLLLAQLRPGSRVVSHDWDMGDWPADETLQLRAPEKPLGSAGAHQVLLWVIPARLAGRWQVQLEEAGEAVVFHIEQKYQSLSIKPSRGQVRMASLRGRQVILHWHDGERTHRLQGTVSEDGQHIKGSAGSLNQEQGKRAWWAVRK